MKCSRCGSHQPNQSCYVCREDEPPARETPDEQGGSLLKTMQPDTIRTGAAFALVLSVIALVLVGASGCRDAETYLAIIGLAIMAAFVGSTQDT